MKKIVAFSTMLAVLCFLTLFTTGASATTGSANLTVTVQVDSACGISTTPVTFPMYAPTGTNATNPDDSTGGAVIVTCTTGTSSVIALSTGAHYSSTTRMASGTDFIDYYLFSDASHSSMWVGTYKVTLGPAPDTSPRTLLVYGRIPAGQSVPSGTYTDTVVASVEW